MLGILSRIYTNNIELLYYFGYNFGMDFEFDPEKSSSNFLKHGIGFEEARDLWNDPDLLEIPAKNMDEPRSLVIGKIRDKYWSAIITYRSRRIRIISVRRSREKEIKLYEGT